MSIHENKTSIQIDKATIKTNRQIKTTRQRDKETKRQKAKENKNINRQSAQAFTEN